MSNGRLRKVVFPVAGLGTRFLPATKVVAKEMLPVLDRPLIQYAVDVLQVKHVMVVGHYGCGGVKAALDRARVGLVDIWLRHVVDVHVKHRKRVDCLPEDLRHDRLCELNALEQVVNVAQTVVVQDAWRRGQQLTVHAWAYGLKDGLMTDLGLNVSRPEDLMPRYLAALEALNP